MRLPHLKRATLLFAIAAVFLAVFFWTIWWDNSDESRIADAVSSAGGEVSWSYHGPDWIPGIVGTKLRLFRRLERLSILDVKPEVEFGRLANCRELYSMTVHGVDADDVLSGISHSGSIIYLNLAESTFSTKGVEQIASLASLTALGLYNTNISDQQLAFIGKLEAIKTLSLKNTPVSDDGIVSLAGLRRLKWLDLEGTKVTSRGLTALSKINTLEVLNISRTAVDDEACDVLRRFPSLQCLIICDSSITDRGLEKLAESSSLKALNIRMTQTTATGRAIFKHRIPSCDLQSSP